MLKGKVALVTGAGRGLGRQHALALAGAGAAVVVNDLGVTMDGTGVDHAPALSVVEEIRALGGIAVADFHNAADWTAAATMIESAVTHFGDLDIVVNNAGFGPGISIEQMSEQEWDQVINANLKSVAAVSGHATRYWSTKGRKPGRALISTSSPAGPHPLAQLAAYAAAKAGVLAYTQAAAIELAPLGVKVNAIAPMARTRMSENSPLTEILKALKVKDSFDRFSPEHVAQLVLYLASPLCRFTGRLFGAEGDDVFLWREWNAAYHANNGARKWTTEALAAAFEAFPQQDERWNLFPGGRVMGPSPTDDVLESVGGL